MQKWEYCIGYLDGDQCYVYTGTTEGVETRTFYKPKKDAGGMWYMQALATLGEEGWEMYARQRWWFHFKRPLQEG